MNARFSQGNVRVHVSRGAHPANSSRDRGSTMHRSTDQAILDNTGLGIPASEKVAKTKSILVASGTCAPETNPNSTQKGSALSHAYIPDKPTCIDAAESSGSQERCAPQHSHSHDKSVFSNRATKSDIHSGSHTATTSPCLETAKSPRSVTLQSLVTLSKDVHPGSHTATTNSCLVTQQKRQSLGTLQRLVKLRRNVHPGMHTATKSSR